MSANNCIYDLCMIYSGDVADLIFVFFDPIGQALCKRTLSLVEKLNDKHAERMRFYLSKADEAGHEADRQVAMFPSQCLLLHNLCRTGMDHFAYSVTGWCTSAPHIFWRTDNTGSGPIYFASM